VARFELSRSRNAESVLIGVLAGGFSGLTGVGGGAIMVPLLTRRIGLSQHRAHGTSLAIIMFVAMAGVLPYWRAGNIDWRLAAALIPGGLVGVFAGARAMVRVPALQLRLLFGAFLFFVAFRQLAWHLTADAPAAGAEGLAVDLAFGFAGGVLAGVLGVGGGAIFVPAIVIFGLAAGAGGGDPQKIAQGVSLVVIVATAALGTATNLRQDVVDIATARWVMPAAVGTALIAALVANRIDAEVLKRIYGVTALLLGVETMYTSWRMMRAEPVSQRM
jgi:uncharacterized membrane protein YfcA